MGTGYEQEMVWRAQELYCVDRLSYTKVSEITGVSVSALKVWGQKFAWTKKRDELAFIESEIRVDIVRSRKKVLDMLLESENGKECSQMAYAVNALENLAMKQQKAKILLKEHEQGLMGDKNFDSLLMSGDFVDGMLVDSETMHITSNMENCEEKQCNSSLINFRNKEDVIEKLGLAIQYRIAFALKNPQAINSKVVDDILKMLQCFGNLKSGVLSQEKVISQTNVVINAE